jgi:hypothetical protein
MFNRDGIFSIAFLKFEVLIKNTEGSILRPLYPYAA